MKVELNERKVTASFAWVALGVCGWHFAQSWGLGTVIALRFALPDIEDLLLAARLAAKLPPGR